MVKNPVGPTLTFKVKEYSLSGDLVSFNQQNKKKAKNYMTSFATAPLLVMSGFSGLDDEKDSHLKIVTYMIQSMFPPVNVDTINLDDCKRVVLFHLTTNAAGERVIDFRHYALNARQREVHKGIKKLINNNKIPNMKNMEDIADFLLKNKASAYSSESELDDLPNSKVNLSQEFQGKTKGSTISLKLHEVGPRMQLEVVKIQEGFCSGNVVYHSQISKTKKEI